VRDYTPETLADPDTVLVFSASRAATGTSACRTNL